jgi:hypothetical protein
VAGAVSALKFARRAALAAAFCAALSACSAAPRHGAAPPATETFAADPAYDWHGLMIAPFGSGLKDMPVALHEVLQFQDEAHANAETRDQDCYSTGGQSMSFAGRELDEYLLCLQHDRLYRIEATLHLAPDQAAQLLARTCAAWPAGQCAGREGQISFSARLGEESAEREVPLSIILRADPNP